MPRKDDNLTLSLTTKILNTIQDACFVLDKDLRFVFANKKTKEYLEKTSKDLYGKKMEEVFPLVKDSYPYKQFKKAIKEKRVIHFPAFSSIINKWIETHAYPYNSGAIIHFHDFTKRKILQDELKQHSELLQLAQDAFIVLNKNNTISLWDGGAPNMYGWDAKEAVGKLAYKLLKTFYPIPLHEIHAILKENEIWKGELIHTKRSGEKIIVESTWKLLKDSEEFSYLEVNHDTTERKALEERKNEFISMASHELKTPITSLKIFTQVLQNVFNEIGHEKAISFLGKMEGQVDRLTKLVKELLDVSRIESGKLHLQMEAFDIKNLMDEIVEYVQPTTQKHNIICDGITKRFVYGDRDRIGQIIINLLTNAIKYSPNGGKIILATKKNSHNIIVEVRDFGIGILPKYSNKIFERFYQVTSPKEKTYPGLGMGLYICEQIIKRHGGRIWVESTKGKGSSFFFTLPLSKEYVKNFQNQKEIVTL